MLGAVDCPRNDLLPCLMQRSDGIGLHEARQVMAEDVIGLEIQALQVCGDVGLAHDVIAHLAERLAGEHLPEDLAQAHEHVLGVRPLHAQELIHECYVIQRIDVVRLEAVEGHVRGVALPYDLDDLLDLFEDGQHQDADATVMIGLVELRHEGMVEGCDYRPAADAVSPQACRYALYVFPAPDEGGLQLQVDNAGAVDDRQALLQGGDPRPFERLALPRSEIQGPELVKGMVVDGPFAVAVGVDGVAVGAHWHPVRGHLDVRLEAMGSDLHGGAEGWHGVLGGGSRQSLVCQYERHGRSNTRKIYETDWKPYENVDSRGSSGPYRKSTYFL